MIRVCVLVGEGKSEKAFLSSLITNQKNFEPVMPKNNIVFRSLKDKDLFWIFPIPAYGQSHRGGRAMLETEYTYLVAKIKVLGHRWFFGENVEFHYRILTDTDDDNEILVSEREGRIRNSFAKADINPSSLKIYFAKREIESWFIGGLNPATFPPELFADGKCKKSLLVGNVEDIVTPKKQLDDALGIGISGDRIRIGNDMGEFMDVETAKARSVSFKKFMEDLHSDGMLI